MALGKLLLINGILLINAVQDILAADKDFKNIQPLHYTIIIKPYTKHLNEDTFYGSYNASFRIHNATQTITLQSEDVFVYKAEVLTRHESEVTLESLEEFTTTFTDHVYTFIHTPILKQYSLINKTLTLTFENSLLRGIHTLNIQFFGRISNNYKDLFRIPVTNDKGNTSWITATNTLFTGICTLFPCLGDPTDKINFNISIEHHTSEILLSSMPNQQTESEENDMLWTHFSTHVPMSIYEITFLLIPKLPNVISRYNGTIILWGRKETIVLWPKNLNYEPQFFDVANKVVSFYRTRFGNLKIPRIQFIAIPGFQHDAIATPGFILHREEDITFDQKFEVTSIVQRNIIWRFVARQIALQWFLESFKPSIRSYQWFNAVAEFFGVYALDKIFKTSKMMNWFVVHTVHDSLHLDVDNLMEPITYLGNTSSNIIHRRVPSFVKVSALLRMMENVEGVKFWNDTREYLLNKSLTPGNNWICFLYDRASSLPRENMTDYNTTCRTNWEWIQVTSNYPLVRMEERNICDFIIYPLFDTSEWITKQYIDFGLGIDIFCAFLYNIHQNQSYEPADFYWIRPDSPLGRIAFQNETKECLLVVNINHIGYCRVQYDYKDPEMFINVSSYASLPVLTRAQIIDDKYHLLAENKTTLSIWPTIIQYLYNETEYEAWYPVIRIFEETSGFLPFSDDKDIISFKETMSFVLDKLNHHFSIIRDVDDFQSCLRYETIKWACLFNSTLCYFFDEQVKYMIQGLNDDALISYNQSKLLSGPWQEWLHCDGLKHVANINALTKILLNSKLKNNFYYEFVKYLPCLGFNIMLQYLNDVPNIPDAERVILFQSLAAKHGQTHMTEILHNLSFIKPETMKMTTALCIIINHVYSLNVLDKISIFVTPSNIVSVILFPNEAQRDSDLKHMKIELRQSQIRKHKTSYKKLWNMK